MSVFTPEEIAYLQSQRFGRLATVDPQGQPQNAPVGFYYNPALDVIDIGGRFMSTSKKFRNILKNPKVAFVVDDVQPPHKVRGVEIRGTAQALPSGGKALFGGIFPDDGLIRIKPLRIIEWGLQGNQYEQHSRAVGKKRTSN